VRALFGKLINRHECCILGCTELPVLYEKYIDDVNCRKVYDPLMMVMQILKAEYEEVND
jgi:aspartate racemase